MGNLPTHDVGNKKVAIRCPCLILTLYFLIGKARRLR